MGNFWYGFKKGVPVGIGYLAVAFAFGIMCTNGGVSPLMATIISFTNLTSAGQYAGVKLILEGASYFEIGLTVFLINLRYGIMSLSLSQKLEANTPTWKRLIFGFGISDEVYAVASTEDFDVSASYMMGLILCPLIGWTLGTAIGAYGASIFPARLLSSLDFALYAMFIALLMPGAKKSKAVLFVIFLSIAISCIFEYVPVLNQIGLGFKIIIATVTSSLLAAFIFPIREEIYAV